MTYGVTLHLGTHSWKLKSSIILLKGTKLHNHQSSSLLKPLHWIHFVKLGYFIQIYL